ncbi:MAG TPA: thioredoxin [Rhodospirillales bacterium]|nr:thioredoxin [Rhodospirillales bacterium]
MIFGTSKSAAAADVPADVIKDGTTQSFAADVMTASMDRPVIVDFWAPWCGPCKTLTPALEKLVRQARGAVRLVKINIDENQALAAQLRIQSVPTVYAFVGGQPVDGFVGAQPDSKLKAFIDNLTQAAVDPLADALEQGAAALAANDFKGAAKVFSAVLAQDPGNPKATAGMIRSYVGAGNSVAARRLIDGLPPEVKANPEVAAALSAVELAEQGKDSGDLAKLRAAVAARPEDMQSRFDLAVALYGKGKTEAAIDELLHLVRTDRSWNDEAARKQLVKIFEAFGFSHPTAVAARRRLSTILFS